MKLNVKRHVVVQPQDQSIKLIPLTRNLNAIVDAADYEWLSQWNWNIKSSQKTLYAKRDIKPQRSPQRIYMHRAILDLKPDDQREVDHINGNGLDNRRANLRPCTHSQNLANREKTIKNTSGFKGVTWRGGGVKNWQVVIGSQYIGVFLTKKEASAAYKEAAQQIYGEFYHP